MYYYYRERERKTYRATVMMKSTKMQTLCAIGAHAPRLYCHVPHACQVSKVW